MISSTNNSGKITPNINNSIICQNTKALQQRLFNFTFQQFPVNLSLKPIEKHTYFIQNNICNITHQETNVWKPKIKYKKLFSEPKFLLSVERKKVRVINGVKTNFIPSSSNRASYFQGEKVKTSRQRYSNKGSQLKQYKSTDFALNNSLEKLPQGISHEIHRKLKTPHLQFNLHHMLNLKKSTNSLINRKMGSNTPYFKHFNQKNHPFSSRKKNHNHSQQRPSQTADIL